MRQEVPRERGLFFVWSVMPDRSELVVYPGAKRTGFFDGRDPPEPVEVVMPKDFPLAKCYRFDPNFPGGTESDEANVHLLAALDAGIATTSAMLAGFGEDRERWNGHQEVATR
ncbi:MAG: hypothetical protein JXO22_13280 [Phycisphaerae bacterium]|nr:hypothetical protein [Phycisphaerae bacterium]